MILVDFCEIKQVLVAHVVKNSRHLGVDNKRIHFGSCYSYALDVTRVKVRLGSNLTIFLNFPRGIRRTKYETRWNGTMCIQINLQKKNHPPRLFKAKLLGLVYAAIEDIRKRKGISFAHSRIWYTEFLMRLRLHC